MQIPSWIEEVISSRGARALALASFCLFPLACGVAHEDTSDGGTDRDPSSSPSKPARDAGTATGMKGGSGGRGASRPAGSGVVPVNDGSYPKPPSPEQPSPDDSASDPGDIRKLDLLFVVDNSHSMGSKQAALKAAFPKLLGVLTTGRRFDGDPDPFPAAEDIHVGVVSTDMGIPGVNFGTGTNCLPDGGDDGRLQHIPHGDDCDASYPIFLAYSENETDRAKFANDFACIAQLGTGGCGFEQQLEAPLKALWPSVYTDARGNVVAPNPITFLSTTPQGLLGRGDQPIAQGGNLGFLRRDREQGLSLLAIVLVTDEEDCSVKTTEHLMPTQQLAPDSPYAQQDINLRCFYNPQLSYDVANRYYRGFSLLRQNAQNLVVFAVIAGVPPDLVDARAQVDFSDAKAREAYYDDVLGDPRMQEQLDPSTNPGTGTGNLTPSCNRTDADGTQHRAFPPRRIATLARLFGERGTLQSICQDDLSPAIDGVIDLIARNQKARRH